MAAPWSDLPAELLGLLLLHLPCLVDRVSFAAVCRSWRHAAGQRGPAAQLPWLLLPFGGGHGFYSLLSCLHRRLLLPEDARGARCCGSFGGWLVVALHQWHGYALLNPVSGARMPLPDRLRTCGTRCESAMVIRNAVLSAAPTSGRCLVAAFVAAACPIVFWRPGMDCWSAVNTCALEDIIYYDGELLQGFHAVTPWEEVLVFVPHDDFPGELGMITYQKRYSFAQRANHRMSSSWSRYLVESRGKLLMVLRYSSGGERDGDVVRRTRQFRVYEMSIERMPHGRHRASWVELDSLDGQMLFVARGCSRAFQASRFAGFEADCIYFVDDTTLDIFSVLKNDKQYPCCDMGMYSMRDRRVVSCFPAVSPSSCSPPMWYLLSD